MALLTCLEALELHTTRFYHQRTLVNSMRLYHEEQVFVGKIRIPFSPLSLSRSRSGMNSTVRVVKRIGILHEF